MGFICDNTLLTSFIRNKLLKIVVYKNWDDKFNIKWYLPIRYKQIKHLLEKVTTIEVELQYSMTDNRYNGMVADFDEWVIQVANKQFKSEESNPKPKEIITIKELTKKKNKWKFC